MPAECAVDTPTSVIEAQAVEVSGWDAEGQFFVEIADLDLGESGATTARLCHCVASGSLVFVRLLHGRNQDADGRGYPTPNEAHVTEAPDATGRCRIRLTPCQPRAAERRTLVTKR